VLHTAGWLEGGLAMGYEKFVMDVDQAGMMHTLLAGVDLSENGQALEAIREVGPGKHFLGCGHTPTTTATSSGRRKGART
jgi:trimethylamine--corrinoid protein Co-methyltransferase